MSIYNKYIILSILPVLVVITLVLTGLVWVTQILSLSNLLDKGISLLTFFKLIICLLPYLIFIIMPIVSILAVIYVYSRLQEERQILVLRGAGLSNYDLAKPALIASLFVTLIVYYISAYLMPVSYNHLKSNLNHLRENYINSIIEPKTFNSIATYITIYVNKKNKHNIMEGVVLFDNQVQDQRIIFFAEKARIFNSNIDSTELELLNGVRYAYDTQHNLTKLKYEKITVKIDDQTRGGGRYRTSLELFIHEMLWPDSLISIERQHKLIADGNIRLVWPLFNFAFVFLALSGFLRSSYNRKNNIRQYMYTFLPILVITYFHFSLQKAAYKDLDYIFLCYANLFGCIIFSIWQSRRNSL
ncbi:MAG: LptF/LptG family permease [Rickettsiaceae bacterium]